MILYKYKYLKYIFIYFIQIMVRNIHPNLGFLDTFLLKNLILKYFII